jgi:hypothetical protein
MSDKTNQQIAAEYRKMIADTGGVCWRCGRGRNNKPHWWHAEWRIDPHHIVRKPRKNDRRVVIPLCCVCHSIEHGGRFTAFDASSCGRFPNCKPVPLTLEEAIRIKAEKDPEYFDPEFLASCSIKRELVLSICREIEKGSDE